MSAVQNRACCFYPNYVLSDIGGLKRVSYVATSLFKFVELSCASAAPAMQRLSKPFASMVSLTAFTEILQRAHDLPKLGVNRLANASLVTFAVTNVFTMLSQLHELKFCNFEQYIGKFSFGASVFLIASCVFDAMDNLQKIRRSSDLIEKRNAWMTIAVDVSYIFLVTISLVVPTPARLLALGLAVFEVAANILYLTNFVLEHDDFKTLAPI